MIETLFEMAIIFTLIASFIVLFPPFITNMKLTFCSKEIVRAIEVSGSVFSIFPPASIKSFR